VTKRTAQLTSFRTPALLLLLGLLTFWGLACSSPSASEDPLNGEPAEQWASSCLDKDGDGFGVGCGNGPDCDDGDPSVTTQCYACTRNATGCPCGVEGKTVACGELRTSPSGQSKCFMGTKTCSAGVWGPCQQGDSTASMKSPLRPMGLSNNPVSCNNEPCDPYCQDFPDEPDDGMTNPDAGIVGSDAGLQLGLTPVDAGPSTECVTETVEVEPVELDIYLMLDKSGSMDWCPNTTSKCDPYSNSRWSVTTTAIKAFTTSSTANNVGFALDYFPTGSNTCEQTQYATPSVNWTTLTAGASAVATSLGDSANKPDGGTPTLPALRGAITAARARAASTTNRKPIVVLATDGDPNGCGSDINTVSAAAQAGYKGYPLGATVVNEAFVNISSTGTATKVTGDEATGGPFPIGFSFPYYGGNYSQFWVSTNGFLTVSAAPGGAYYTNGTIPSTSAPNDGVIAPFWDDLRVNGDIYYQTFGTAPNRYLIVQWYNTSHYSNSSASIPMQAVLWENGDISFRYGSLSGTYSDGSSATIGVENPSGSDGVQHSNNASVLSSNTAIRFHTQPIETYVIGVGLVANLNTIAANGGTGTAYITDSGNSASFIAAMEDIRKRAIGCDYPLPTPADGNLDLDATTVGYRLGSGASTPLDKHKNEDACAGGHGYYYDSGPHPAAMHLCPATCNLVQSNANYRVDLSFACKANCGSSSVGVDPVPLDMVVMLDRSGSMAWCANGKNPPCPGGALTRWNAVKQALGAYAGSTDAAGTTMALDYFPLPESDQCPVSHYMTPSVDWSLLPGKASDIQSSLNGTNPNGGTPTVPALQGAINLARQRAIANPNNKVVVVLATDGEPNNCSSTIAGVAAVAADGLAGGAIVTPAVTVGNEALETTTGTATGATGDEVTKGPFNIGFTYRYYGVNYTQFYVNTNGFVALGSSPPSNSYINTSLPDSGTPNGVIAPFWDDLVVVGNVYYQTLGTAPNRRLVVTWKNARHWSKTGSCTFEAVLHENGEISFRYGSMSGTYSDASSATIGIENASGTQGHTYSYNTARTLSNTSLRYKWTEDTFPSIPTYVIGVGYESGLNSIAVSGGSSQAYIVSGGSASEFAAAMKAIRAQALGCEYMIPSSSLGVPDPEAVTVRYSPGNGGNPVDFPLRSSTTCGSEHGYYFDNPANPQRLYLCSASCDLLATDSKASVAIFYDCLGNYNNGVFTRDYNAAGMCPPGSSHLWSKWIWESTTPNGTSIDFTVATADTQAGLDTAEEVPLLFSTPEGPSSLVGQAIGAKEGPPDTQSGSADVDQTLALKLQPRKKPFLRVRAHLRGAPPTFTSTPLLSHWNLTVSCENSE